MSTRCTICNHPKRHDIEYELLAGVSQVSLAQQYGLSTSALSRHHQHLKKRLADAKEALAQEWQQELLVTLTSSLKMLLMSAESSFNDENHAQLIRTAREIANTYKLIRTLNVTFPDFSTYHLLESDEWPLQGTVITDTPDFYVAHRRFLAHNFSRPCHDLEQAAAESAQAQASSSAASPPEACLTASISKDCPSEHLSPPPSSSGREPGRNRETSGMKVGRNRDASGMESGQDRVASGMPAGKKPSPNGKPPANHFQPPRKSVAPPRQTPAGPPDQARHPALLAPAIPRPPDHQEPPGSVTLEQLRTELWQPGLAGLIPYDLVCRLSEIMKPQDPEALPGDQPWNLRQIL